jgi:prevent-host-death family protein
MKEVSIRDLKSRLSEHLRRVGLGERITITSRGKPVGVIVPPPQPEETDDERLHRKLLELKERGILLQVGKGKPKAPRKRVELIGEGPTVSEMVLADRGDPIP